MTFPGKVFSHSVIKANTRVMVPTTTFVTFHYVVVALREFAAYAVKVDYTK